MLSLTLIIQAATGDNSEVYNILERVISTATAVGEAFKDEVNAKDAQLTLYTKELL